MANMERGAKIFDRNKLPLSTINYLKSIFFVSNYWITLTVVLMAGATKISIFSLGYLIGCFIFLWLGNDAYLIPISRLKCYWNAFVLYAVIVIVTKITLQIYACYIHQYLIENCYILLLLRVVCYNQVPATNLTGSCSEVANFSQFDILLDILCLVFLLLQRFVFGSYQFRYQVNEVKAQRILASRGAELIMATQIEEAKAQDLYEKEVMRSVREKMDNLKSDNEQTSKAWQRLLILPHHHQIIRNADKHLFSSTHDEPMCQTRRSNDWKFKRAFIPDPVGDELERMAEINGISAVFTRWMKGRPLYGSASSAPRSGSDATPSPHTEPADIISPLVPDDADTEKTPSPETTRRDDPETTIHIPSMGDQQGHDLEDHQDDADNIELIDSSVPPEEVPDSRAGSSGQAETELDESSETGGRLRGFKATFNLIVYSCLLSMTVKLNRLSRSYRYVSRRMALEKGILKKQFELDDPRFRNDSKWCRWVISTLSETYTRQRDQSESVGGHKPNTTLHRIRSALKAIESSNGSQQVELSSSGPAPSMSDSDRQTSSPPVGSPMRSPASATSVGTRADQQQHPSQQQQQKFELTEAEYHFLKLNMFTQFFRALAYVFISNTALLCQLVMIFNQMLNASLLSLPLPLLTFLWGTLSVPRPSKLFWKTVITYTEIVIGIKYVCLFPLISWETNNINPFYMPNLLGFTNVIIIYDLILLSALFFHRAMLKSLGQWDSSPEDQDEMLANDLGINLTSSAHSPQPSASSQIRNGSVNGNGRFTGKAMMLTSPESAFVGVYNDTYPGPSPVTSGLIMIDQDSSVELSRRPSSVQAIPTCSQRFVSLEEMIRTQSYHGDLNDPQSYQHDNRVPRIQLDQRRLSGDIEDHSKSRASRCYQRVRNSIARFFSHVLNTPHKIQTDVYTWMFLCDFINFLILIYGFWAFGSGYTNQTVASFLNENRIPFSVLIMLLAQFASMIIDRAFYLQKNIGGKLTFQLILVVGIHFWLFFALPFTTGHTLTLKQYWPPKAFYVFKCIYFLLSAYQIKSGYPRRVLGHCFTKGFGYANWGAFKVYRAIPLVYDLRLYMDWIWTETTLEFRNWSIMEDMFANLFIRKCELTLEEEYPYPRARPINRLSKYLTGGAFILLILAIIWGPLLLFSMGKTVGESNPPVEMEYELEFVGFQPILRLRASAQQITTINLTLYDLLKAKFVSQNSQSFLSDYKVGDVAAIRLDGQSNAVWEISPPSMDLLKNRILNNETLILKSTWSLLRIKQEKSQTFDASIGGSHQFVVGTGNESQAFRQGLYQMLSNSSTTQTPNDQFKYVITPPIFPNFIRVPETGQASVSNQFEDNLFDFSGLRSLNLSYVRVYDPIEAKIDSSTSWWKADDLCKFSQISDSYSFWSPDVFPHCESLLLVAFNDRIFTGILALLSAPGIIGLYTTFVVFFARLIRTEPSGKVIYTEIPKVDRVYGLVMDIYMMREFGEYELEEKLFAKLLFLYRSPEMLIEWSKREDELNYSQIPSSSV